MIKLKKIAIRDLEQQKKLDVKQLNLTDITGNSHGEDRTRSMREGFYFRRNRLPDLIE